VLQLLCETEAGTVSILCGCKFRSWLSLPTAIALGGVHCDWWESEWEWRAGFGRESRPSEHAVKRSASILISTEMHVSSILTYVSPSSVYSVEDYLWFILQIFVKSLTWNSPMGSGL
jgi:hypothetical protein